MELLIIQEKIYELRGQKVIFDFDLASLYEVETKRLKEAVRRNRKKFPADFMLELTKKEWTDLRSQFASSSWGGLRYPPFAFTEHGVTTAGLSYIMPALQASDQKSFSPGYHIGAPMGLVNS